MSQVDLYKIIQYIVNNALELKNKYVKDDLVVDYVAIFSQNDQEYTDLNNLASEIGDLAEDTPTGPVYQFRDRPQTRSGKPYFLKIRQPDPTRIERGDVDFNTQYSEFKKRYLDNSRFTLIERKDFEMIELMDGEFDVRVYFSSEPLSKRLGVS